MRRHRITPTAPVRSGMALTLTVPAAAAPAQSAPCPPITDCPCGDWNAIWLAVLVADGVQNAIVYPESIPVTGGLTFGIVFFGTFPVDSLFYVADFEWSLGGDPPFFFPYADGVTPLDNSYPFLSFVLLGDEPSGVASFRLKRVCKGAEEFSEPFTLTLAFG